MEAGTRTFVLALVFLVTSLVLLLYRTLNPDRRSDLVEMSISRSALCGVAFAVSAMAKIVEPESYRIQVLALALVNLAIIYVVAGICTVQSRSYGTVEVSPKAREFLRHGKRVFLVTFGISIAMSLLWPAPVQQDYAQFPLIYLPIRALVTFPEMFFPAVAAYVALQAARSQEPVGRIRVQQISFFISHVVLASIGVNTYLVVCYGIFVENDELRRNLIERQQSLDILIVAIISLTFLLGLFLYYVNDDRSRAITRFNSWRRERERWEHRLHSLDDKTVAEQYSQYGNIKGAAADLIERANQEEREDSFCYDHVRKSQLTFKVLTVTLSPGGGIDREVDAELVRLIKYSENLLREPSNSEMSWTITEGASGEFTFDLRTDPLVDVAKQVRKFLHSSTTSAQLVDEPQWFQLAMLAAADANILTGDKAGRVKGGKTVMDRVVRAYNNAEIRKTLEYAPLQKTQSNAVKNLPANRHNI